LGFSWQQGPCGRNTNGQCLARGIPRRVLDGEALHAASAPTARATSSRSAGVPGRGKTTAIRRDEMTHSIAWDHVTDSEVVRALNEYDQLGPERFFAEHGFGPTTTYDLVWNEQLYPPKAILGTAYEFATGQRLASGDFEGGKAGAVKVLGKLGFTVRPRG
jgi:hypothetical protein